MRTEKALNSQSLLRLTLVDEHEQLYKIPSNWVWTRLGVLFNLVTESFSPLQEEIKTYVGLEHLSKGGGIEGISTTDGIKSNKNSFVPGDILYGKLRPYLNKHVYVDFEGVV